MMCQVKIDLNWFASPSLVATKTMTGYSIHVFEGHQ